MVRTLILVGLASLVGLSAAATVPLHSPIIGKHASNVSPAPSPSHIPNLNEILTGNFGPDSTFPFDLNVPIPSPAVVVYNGTVREAFPISFDPSPVSSRCFPGTATVELQDGSYEQMSALQIGDRVKVADATFSDVFMFTHKLADAANDFVVVQTSSGAELSLTAGHYLYVNGALVAAGTIRVGDVVESATGERLAVTSVRFRTMDGLYNPQTIHGDIIVNGIRASTFTTAVQPSAAQALLAPLRAMYARLGFLTAVFNQGSDFFANKMPSGAALVA